MNKFVDTVNTHTDKTQHLEIKSKKLSSKSDSINKKRKLSEQASEPKQIIQDSNTSLNQTKQIVAKVENKKQKVKECSYLAYLH